MPSSHLLAIARQALDRCDGTALTRRAVGNLRFIEEQRVYLVAVGKAAAAMATGAVQALRNVGVHVASGLVVDKGTAQRLSPPLNHLVGAHPIPNARSAAAGRQLLDYIAAVPADARLLALVSGGTSSLIATPHAGQSMDELASLTARLLHGGVPVGELNARRRQLSRVAAGGLARAAVASIDVLVMSDVLGDDFSVIGSGPFFSTAKRQRSNPVTHSLVANHGTLLDACVDVAREAGERRIVLCPPDSDDVADCAGRWLERARSTACRTLFIGGGEPTVRVTEVGGVGGRNHHLALLMARAAAGMSGVSFAAIASDGDDGNSGAAGACVDGFSWQAMMQKGDPRRSLRLFDSHSALTRIGASIAPWCRGSNLLDLHLLLVEPPPVR